MNCHKPLALLIQLAAGQYVLCLIIDHEMVKFLEDLSLRNFTGVANHTVTIPLLNIETSMRTDKLKEPAKYALRFWTAMSTIAFASIVVAYLVCSFDLLCTLKNYRKHM